MVDRTRAGEILSEMVEIVRAFRAAGQRSRERTLTGTKIGVLKQLSHCDARLGELAENLVVSAPVASRAVDALEADGLVERRADAQDGRALVISITDRGRAELAEREDHFVGRFADALADWSPEEAGQAVDILRRLNVHLDDVLGALESKASGDGHPRPDRDPRVTTPDDESEGDR